MKAAGLTHGGFYRRFASKEALIDEGTTPAFDELAHRRSRAGFRPTGGRPARADRRRDPRRRAQP
ncbi:TetR family transcriptional regulator [Streptomyces sp. NBC_01530]|uniref:TetR family transcriptional regulator n=1 Tax=Streptomyces sp. NBC_01530 TaxID=2903895 RepID=UPI00386C8406